MHPSPPSPPPGSPSGEQARGLDVETVPVLSSTRWQEDNDDELSRLPCGEYENDDDRASTTSTSTMTPAAEAAAAANQPPPPPPISRLPEEMLSCIFSHLPPVDVGRASCVCAAWREAAVGWDAFIWREALARALGSHAAAEAARGALAAASAASSSPPESPASSTSSSLSAAPPPPPLPPLPLLLEPTWRQSFLATPAPRCDGFYVSRETYIRAGLTEWTVRNPVHVVVYFRYYRFFPPQAEEEGEEGGLKPPRGRFWYRTTPDPPAKAARSLALGPPRVASSSSSSEKSSVVEGRYRLGGGGRPSSSGRKKRVDPSMLRTAWRVRNSAGTEVRAKLRLRCAASTAEDGGQRTGAWDRMDVVALASHDLASGLTLPFSTQQQQTDDGGGVFGGGFPAATVRRGRQRQPAPPPPLTHSRGLSTFAFIPWGRAIEDSPLNLPLSQMDCWIPG